MFFKDFDILMLKIKKNLKKIILIYFQVKNILKKHVSSSNNKDTKKPFLKNILYHETTHPMK